MLKDPIIEEVRKHRNEYAAQFNFDLDAIEKRYRFSEKDFGKARREDTSTSCNAVQNFYGSL